MNYEQIVGELSFIGAMSTYTLLSVSALVWRDPKQRFLMGLGLGCKSVCVVCVCCMCVVSVVCVCCVYPP